MYFYRLDLTYNGRFYQGWQTQPHQQTIQDQLNAALHDLDPALQTMAAGRTDAGVHALKQVVRLSLSTHYAPAAVQAAANAHLPAAIRVQQVREAAESFHPLHNAGKEYRYFWAPQVSPFQEGLITKFDYAVDLALLQAAAAAVEGQHDFARFACRGTPVSSTVRDIYAAQIEYVASSHPAHRSLDDEWPGEFPLNGLAYYQFTIIGSGFLKQMVRLLMGGIFNVGRGKLSLTQWQAALKDGAIKGEADFGQATTGADVWHGPRLGPVAAPDGLYLAQVFFSAAERDARVRQLKQRLNS